VTFARHSAVMHVLSCLQTALPLQCCEKCNFNRSANNDDVR